MGSGAIGAHLDELRRRNLRPSTISQRRNVLRRLARYADGDPVDATPAQLEAFIDRLTTAESRATEISHLRQFFRWAVEVGIMQSDPTVRLRRPRVRRRLPRPISEGDLFVALELAPDRVRPWLLLAGWAGLRCAEIAPLRAEDIWWHVDPPILMVRESKGGDEETVELSGWLVDQLAGCDLPKRGWLFPRRDGNPGHTPAHLVSQLGNSYLRSVGIDKTMHTLRHRFGTMALRGADGNLRTAQEALRHKTPVSTQIYTYIDRSEVRAAVERIPTP